MAVFLFVSGEKMKKYILIICYAFSWVTPAIALNESGNKEITVTTIDGQLLTAPESEHYSRVYDNKYQKRIEYYYNDISRLGLYPSNFMNAVKIACDCYATVWAQELSVNDYKLMESDTSFLIKVGIRDEIDNKISQKCEKQLENLYTNILQTYISKECAVSKNCAETLVSSNDKDYHIECPTTKKDIHKLNLCVQRAVAVFVDND